METIIKENLDLGCEQIRYLVRNEAVLGIQTEGAILEAIRNREQAMRNGGEYRDRTNMDNFSKLPDLLKPSETGLTDTEFQVYQDFDLISEQEQQAVSDIDRLLDDNQPPRPDRTGSAVPTDDTPPILQEKLEAV